MYSELISSDDTFDSKIHDSVKWSKYFVQAGIAIEKDFMNFVSSSYVFFLFPYTSFALFTFFYILSNHKYQR